MRNYGVARSVFGLIEFLFWMGVVIGILVAFGGAGAATRGFGAPSGALAAAPGILVAMLSLVGVAIAQNGRASVDSAEYGQQMLKVARDQLEISKQTLRQGELAQSSFLALVKTQENLQAPEPSEARASFAKAPTSDAKGGQSPAESVDDIVRVTGDTLSYKGQSAALKDGKWHLNGIPFDTRDLLVDYIDQFGVKAVSKPLLKAER